MAVPPRNNKPGRLLAGRPARRWRLAGVLIAIVVVLAALVATAVFHAGSGTPNAGASAANGSQTIASEAATRGRAVTWILSQVGRNIVVACDAVVCNDLAQHGFPAGDLNVLQPTATDPYGSEVVVASEDVRSQFGSKLAAVYAPELIASFGAGTNRIDIRVIAQSGPTAFRAAVSKDALARKQAGAELVANKKITIAGSAASQLTSGQVDLRLETAIAFLAVKQPLDILGFGTSAPGAGPGVPLRFAYLAESDAASHLSASQYLSSLLAGLHALRPPYVPLSETSVSATSVSATSAQLPGGQTVLRVEFAAPSPAGLLSY